MTQEIGSKGATTYPRTEQAYNWQGYGKKEERKIPQYCMPVTVAPKCKLDYPGQVYMHQEMLVPSAKRIEALPA